MDIHTVTLPARADTPACVLAYTLFTPPDHLAVKGDVVCVHGLTRQKRDFDFLAQALAASGYRVFAIDAPGRGDSSALAPDQYHLPAYAEIFAQALPLMHLHRVHWIGTSMGGLIALTLAAQGHAALFQSLTLVDITHRPNLTACARIADYVVENLPVLDSVDQLLAILKINLPLGPVSDDVWWHYAAHQLRKTDAGYVFHFDPKLARLAAPALRQQIDITDGLTRLTCPLALVAGEISDLCTPQEISDLQKRRPDMSLHICAGAGHIPALADAETQKFITDFLNATPQD